ncbi:uncharacterized protein [Heterodontus francisci]|uniref:uncharacterized protein n=1 Tax=Heterodontus francisci TaxID=7792 RepID=UPI00355B3670
MTTVVERVPFKRSVELNWKDSECITERSQVDQCLLDLCSLESGDGEEYLKLVTKNVMAHRGKIIPLAKKLSLRIGDLNDTVYWGRTDLLECWENLYLPQETKMAVLGTIDCVPCLAPGCQLVILVGADRSVFAYEEEILHKTANNLTQLFEKGATLPGTEIYEYGKGFRPKSNEEYLAALKDAGLEKISQDTKDFISRNAAEMKELMDDLNFL